MARSRRSRGPIGPAGTLGTLLRTTLAQAGVVRDVLERGAREGRARLDDVRRERRRDDSLARLGAAVLSAVRAGELDDVYNLPDAAEALAELDELDAGHDGEPEGGSDAAWIAPRTRERFDQRASSERFPRGEASARGERAERADRDSDGTVSSASWRPPPPAPPVGVWRPSDESARAERNPVESGSTPRRRDKAEPGARFAEPRGGIQFASDDEEDDDLAAYMNPADVPRKLPDSDESDE